MSKIAFIYPGQGAQVCGMGQDFYEQTKEGKETFDLATDILGFSVPELCFICYNGIKRKVTGAQCAPLRNF